MIAAGPFVNAVIAFVIFFALFSTGSEGTNEVSVVTQDGAAAGVLMPGDELVAVDGVTGDFNELREQIATHTCPDDAETDGCEAATAAELTIVRNGTEITRTVTPTYSTEAGRMLVGFEPGTKPCLLPPEAVGLSTDAMWAITSGTAEVFANIFDAEQRKQISGVVGSYETTRQAIEFDARTRALHLGRDLAVAWRSSTSSRSCRWTAGTSSGRWLKRSAAGPSPSASWSVRASWGSSWSRCSSSSGSRTTSGA